MQFLLLLILATCVTSQDSGSFSLHYCEKCNSVDEFHDPSKEKSSVSNIPDDKHVQDKTYLNHFFLKLEGDGFNSITTKRWVIIFVTDRTELVYFDIEMELEFVQSVAHINFFSGSGFMYFYNSGLGYLTLLPAGMTPKNYRENSSASDSAETPRKFNPENNSITVNSMYSLIQKMIASQTNPLTQEEYEEEYAHFFKTRLPTMTNPNYCYDTISSAHLGAVAFAFDEPWSYNHIGEGVLTDDDGKAEKKKPYLHIRVVPTKISEEICKKDEEDEECEGEDCDECDGDDCDDELNGKRKSRRKIQRRENEDDIDPDQPVDITCDPFDAFTNEPGAFVWDFAAVFVSCFQKAAKTISSDKINRTQYLKVSTPYKLSVIVFYIEYGEKDIPGLAAQNNFEKADIEYSFITAEYACGDNLHCVDRQGTCNYGLSVCDCFSDFDGFLCDHRINLSPIAIAIIAIGSILFIALLAGGLGVYIFKRRLRAKRKITLTAPDFEKLRFATVKKPEYPPEISSRFRQDVIEQLIINDEPGMMVLWEVCKLTPVTDSDNFAKALVYGFEKHKKALSLIMFLITKEVQESEDDPDTLFRANSFATKTFKFYSKMIGLPYLFRTIAVLLQGMLRDLADQEQSSKVESDSDVKLFKVEVELDPEKMDNAGDENINVLMLQLTCQKFLVQILRSAGDCPGEFKQLCAHIKRVVEQRFPGYVYKAIGAFMFLRFFNTGITVPETYGLMTTPPKPTARRQLILLSKVLQNLANGVKFGAKESFMTKLNGFISANQEKLKGFYDRLCDDSAFAVEKLTVPDSIYNPSIAHIYNQCANAYLTNEEIFSSQRELLEMLMTCTDPNQVVHDDSDEQMDEEMYAQGIH